jgi:serine/threonine protein phosphatase 1
MPLVGDATLPEGLRIYAVGDVHGCLDRLTALHADIAADLERRPVGDHRIVHCGDYVDRGPQSAGVLALLVERSRRDRRIVCLYGNHEEELEGFFDDPERWREHWLRYGGGDTMKSYGVDVAGYTSDRSDLDRLSADFALAFPADHRRFVADCPRMARFGDFVFVHAGIRPGVDLDRQDPHDLVWIREPFLSDPRDHGAVVVHGHTPVETPDVRGNRINIDTGAVYGGTLTCLVIEGDDIRFLSA